MGLVSLIKSKVDQYKENQEEKKQALEEEKKLLKAAIMTCEEGILPIINQPVNLILKKDELLHGLNRCDIKEVKNEIVGYSGSTSGVSVRVAKGISVRSGSSRGKAIRKDIASYYSGIIYVTSKRVSFIPHKDGNNFNIDYSKIIAVKKLENGIIIEKEGKSYTVLMDESELVHAILKAAIKKFNS